VAASFLPDPVAIRCLECRAPVPSMPWLDAARRGVALREVTRSEGRTVMPVAGLVLSGRLHARW
jgi:hypothetical protein